jgi:hypothetical protein
MCSSNIGAKYVGTQKETKQSILHCSNLAFSRLRGRHQPRRKMQPPASDRRPLGVFWDIENCSIPRGKSALAVCEKIRGEDFCRGHSEIQFAVVCDATKESPFVLDDLLKAQVGRGTRTDEPYRTGT